MTDLHFPDVNTMEEVVFALINDFPIQLHCNFSDEIFNSSQELQDAILVSKMSGTFQELNISNACYDQEVHNQCFDFALRCIDGQQNKIQTFRYSSLLPLTLADANRSAVAIASNDNIKTLGLRDKDRIFFEEGTFECMLDAILEKGTIESLGLVISPTSMQDIMGRNCISKSNLGTNTTLKVLGFVYYPGTIHHHVVCDGDEGMKQLEKVLKVNRGLECIWISRKFITNKGRRYILDGVRDNITLMDVRTNDEMEEVENNERNNALQFQIDHHMKLNKIWHQFSGFRYLDLGETWGIFRDIQSERAVHISFKNYPYFLEWIAKKPAFLYLFLQKKNHILFDHYSERNQNPHRRRRSMRVLKKRRILAGG